MENGYGIFPSLRWAAPRELLCSFPGADKSPEKVLWLTGVPKEQLVLQRWVSVGFGSRGQGWFRVESSLSHGR